MVCIYCEDKTRVTNSRSSMKTGSTWRRRQCLSCGSLVTTREQIDLTDAIRVSKTGKNSSGSLEPFSRDKLFMSVYRSLKHRKTVLEDAAALTDTIIYKLTRQHTNGILNREEIIRTASPILKRFDLAASVSYLAYHKLK